MLDLARRRPVVHFVANVGGGVWSCVRTLATHHRSRFNCYAAGVYKGRLRVQREDECKELFEKTELARRPSFPGSYHLLPLDVTAALSRLGVAPSDDAVFHFHTGPYTPLVFRLPRRLPAGRWIATFHGSRGNFGDDHNRWKRAMHGRCVRKMIRAGFTLAAVSQRSAADCAAMYGCRETDFQVVYNGAGEQRSLRLTAPRSECQSPLHVGFVGTVSPIKGWRKVVDAVALLREQQRDVVCTIVGDGAEYPQLGELAASREWLSAPGHVADPAAQAIPKFDVLVLASEFEGQPIVLLEAMAAGVPCICSDVGGNAETIRDGRDGFVLDESTPAEIATQLAQLADTKGLWRRFADSCFERQQSEFTAAHMANRWEQLYASSGNDLPSVEGNRDVAKEARES